MGCRSSMLIMILVEYVERGGAISVIKTVGISPQDKATATAAIFAISIVLALNHLSRDITRVTASMAVTQPYSLGLNTHHQPNLLLSRLAACACPPIRQ